MSDQITMTMTANGQTTGPFTMDQLTAACASITEPLVAQAAAIVIRDGKCSTSYVQRMLAIGYNRAAGIVETLEGLGIVTSADHVGKREVVATEVPAALARACEAAASIAKARPPMKETPEDQEVTDKVHRATANEVRQIVEQIERVQAEIADLKVDEREFFKSAKHRGYDTKVLRKVIALRKRDKDDVAEEEAVLELYKDALGMV